MAILDHVEGPRPFGDRRNGEAVLAQALRLLAEPLILPQVLARLAQLVQTHLEVDGVQIWLRELHSFRLCAQALGAHNGQSRQREAGSHDLPLDLPPSCVQPSLLSIRGRKAENELPAKLLKLNWIQHRGPLVLPELSGHSLDPGRVDPDLAWLRDQGWVSLLGLPVLVDDERVGALVLLTEEPRAFSESEVSLAEALASSVTAAVAQAHRHQQEKDLQSEFRQRVRAAGSAGEVKDIVLEACRTIAQTTGGDRATVCFWDAESGQIQESLTQLADGLRPSAADGRCEGPLEKCLASVEDQTVHGVPLLSGLVGSRQAVSIDDALDSPEVPHELAKLFQARSLVAVPLRIGEDTPGALIVHTVDQVRPFGPRQVELVVSWGDQLTFAVEKARLHREREDRLGQTEASLMITQTLSSVLELKPLLRVITRQAARACSMDRCTVSLVEGDYLVPVMARYARGSGNPEHWKFYRGLGKRRIGEIPYFAEIMRTGQPLVSNNPAKDPLWSATSVPFDTKALVAVPLVRHRKVVGLLSLGNVERTDPVTPQQVDSAVSVASQVALAIENARLYEETQRRLGQAEAQLEIARTLSSTLELTLLLKKITQQTAQACGMDRCTIDLIEGDSVVSMMSQYADGRMDRRRWQAYKERGPRSLAEFPQLQAVLKTRRPLIVNDPDQYPDWPTFSGETLATKVLLAVPLLRQSKVVGVVSLSNVHRNAAVTPEQADLATTIASQVALAIDNARLYEETQRRLRQAEGQLEIAHTLSSKVELKPLLKVIARHTASVCGMDRCTVNFIENGLVLSEMSQYADGRVDKELLKVYKARKPRLLEDLPFIEQVVRSRKPLAINNPQKHPDVPDFIKALKSRAMLTVPLIGQDRVVGVLVLSNVDRGDPVTSEQVALATTIASPVALAIDNARLYEETQRRLRETGALLSLAQAIGSSLDRHEIARRTARELARLVGADSSIFYQVDEGLGNAVVVAGYHLTEAMRSMSPLLPLNQRGTFVRESVSQGQPVAASDLPNDSRFDHPTMRALPQPQSLLIAPVTHKGREVGGLVCFWWTKRHESTDEELRLAKAFAHHMALVLENAQHYEQAQQALTDLRTAQEKLIQAEKFQALAEMAAGVAHDFNNLLTSILGQTEFLRFELGKASGEVQSSLDTIELAASDGAETVQRLFDYTRSKPRPEQSLVVDLRELLVDTREVAKPRWRNRNKGQGKIEVVLESAATHPTTGSPPQLREVLLNLVFNAIDAMPEGGTLTLASGDDQDHVFVKIKDTGVGMSEEVRQRIFDPFYSTKGEGSTGLGLSASFGIIRRHGGEIEVESEPGCGTTFTVKLPRSA